MLNVNLVKCLFFEFLINSYNLLSLNDFLKDAQFKTSLNIKDKHFWLSFFQKKDQILTDFFKQTKGPNKRFFSKFFFK